MSCVERLITEDLVDREELGGHEGRFLGNLVEHACADSSCVCAQDVLLGLGPLPLVLITNRTCRTAVLVRCLDARQILLRQILCHTHTHSQSQSRHSYLHSNITHIVHLRHLWVRHKECVVCVARGVLLRLEQRVEVPKTILNILIRWHFTKATTQKKTL